jgi:(E)-4-hydroxy-3-methylbut-2-enyl-diphosphate synthase
MPDTKKELIQNDISTHFNYTRRNSREVKVGNLGIGGNNPIRIQSMANTDTNDTIAGVKQTIKVSEAGGELMRFTAQGIKEAENLQHIHKQLREAGYTIPLVADIHFNPKAAEVAAQYVEKVRINPGNFVDSVHTGDKLEYTDEEYKKEIEKIKAKLFPLLEICRKHKTALRIGVNHGSLSRRIISRYGDTSHGMVESCMEFLRLCGENNFHEIILSIKASNTVIMVQTVRLLVATMTQEGMAYPLHLGVTEAGDGEDGRIKSAVGIGALLAEGIGDTIRVSLSEDPECEIPVAGKLVEYVNRRESHGYIHSEGYAGYSPFVGAKRETQQVGLIGGKKVPVVIASSYQTVGELIPDYVYIGNDIEKIQEGIPSIIDYDNWQNKENLFPLFSIENIEKIRQTDATVKFLQLSFKQYSHELITKIDDNVVFILTTDHQNGLGEQRAFIHTLMANGVKNPVVLKRAYKEPDIQNLQIMTGADLGVFFIDNLADGIWIKDEAVSPDKLLSVSFGVLQAARVRISKTEFISCPGCGRTLFDLQATVAKVKEKTSHLKGLKIGIMGCIVNGPGEMADADYGYVGSARGKVNLYKGRKCIEKLISEDDAVETLIRLIKDNGDWQDKKPEK